MVTKEKSCNLELGRRSGGGVCVLKLPSFLYIRTQKLSGSASRQGKQGAETTLPPCGSKAIWKFLEIQKATDQMFLFIPAVITESYVLPERPSRLKGDV